MKSNRLSWLAVTLWLAVSALMTSSSSRGMESANTTSVQAPMNPANDADARCTRIVSTDFSAIEDAPTQLVESKSVAKTDDLPAYCQVLGYVWPQVGFDLRLPVSGWNGKFMQIGCHSYCGTSFPIDDCSGALRRGYVCVTTDMGHKGTRTSGDGLWAHNNLQAKVDWGYRGTHVVAVSAKAITTRYYGKPPVHSYFAGWSAGARQGLVEAQRFPWDFDGILCGTGQIDWLGAMMTAVWIDRISHDAQGQPILRLEDFQLLHDAALARCDGDDGLKDGIIDNPLACRFDPSELLCHGTASENCLSEVQLGVIKKYYSGPLSSTGVKIYEEGAMMPGSELSWPGWYSLGSKFGAEVFRYAGFDIDPGATWTIRDFDFDKDYKRLDAMGALYSGTNPDLRKLKAAGGRLIFWQGWAEVPGPPLAVVRYYESVERLLGGRAATQDFFRLFMIPGLGHTGSEGGISIHTVDFLSYLEDWVEKGRAPGRVIGARLNGPDDLNTWPNFPLDPQKINFTRPIYPYPTQVKYKGAGDPNKADNFMPVEP